MAGKTDVTPKESLAEVIRRSLVHMAVPLSVDSQLQLKPRLVSLKAGKEAAAAAKKAEKEAAAKAKAAKKAGGAAAAAVPPEDGVAALSLADGSEEAPASS